MIILRAGPGLRGVFIHPGLCLLMPDTRVFSTVDCLVLILLLGAASAQTQARGLPLQATRALLADHHADDYQVQAVSAAGLPCCCTQEAKEVAAVCFCCYKWVYGSNRQSASF